MAHVQKRPNGKYLVRWKDYSGSERSKQFVLMRDANAYKAEIEKSLNDGSYLDPMTAKMTVNQWADLWIKGQQMHRPNTLRQAVSDLKRIRAAFGHRQLRSIKPVEVKAWVATMQDEGLAPSTVYARHRRLKQLIDDAVNDGVLPKSPLGRKSGPKQKARGQDIPTADQVWALYEAVPEGLKPAILLGAFAGLRNGEAVALRVQDVDFLRLEVRPVVQHGGVDLKTDSSRWPVPIPGSLAEELSRRVGKGRSNTFVQDVYGGTITPSRLQANLRNAAATVEGIGEGFKFHSLRHYYASMLIGRGLDIVTVQHCMRHAKASTTLNEYSHLLPDKNESVRFAVDELMTNLTDYKRTSAAGEQ